MIEAEPRTAAPGLTPGALAERVRAGVISREELGDYLVRMCEIRYFEDRIYELVRAAEIRGSAHLSAGQEAVPVGAIATLTRRDLVASTHRGHGHCGAMGDHMAESPEERQDHWNQMMAEILGRTTGYCRGRGGSMHIADVQRGNLGATGIVAGNIPVATGAALAEHLKATDSVVLCFFGEGAANTGAFHEALNMGATLFEGLPVVYICENNLYGMSVPFHEKGVDGAARASSIPHVAQRAAAYGLPAEIVDGQDILAVREVVSRAVERARGGGGPTLIEAKTYRYYGHSINDQRAYRTREEEAAWRQRDPIELFAHRLIEAELYSPEEIDALRAHARATIDEATEFARRSPLPEVSELHDNVYVEPDTHARAEQIAAETRLRERIRPIEGELRRRFRESSGRDAKSVLPRLTRAEAEELEKQHGVPVRPYNEALIAAQREEMARDERVFLLGEDIGIYGGAYAGTRGLLQEFGPRRVIDTAISEAAVVGAACGAAMRGMRPVAEIMYIDFITIASNQLVHNIAYNRYQFGGKIKVPCVVRTEGGVGRSNAATHSESLESWFVHIPGLYVVMPSTPYDAKGLLKAAIRDDNPVLFIEHKLLYSGVLGPVPDEEYLIPLGVADVKKAGSDCTLVAYSRMVHFALEAALELEDSFGISAEVIDPRTLNPLDLDTIAASLRKTGRLIVICECYGRASAGEDILRRAMEYRFPNGRTGFSYLDGPPILLAAKDTPVPMSAPLEDASVPTRADIIDAARALVGRR
jgi:pyruvate/2-oxoglutarate/acetoin dehydrogenase E1 component/TPP-dependent pyruvate/acetoin dehydrogenase alpha subunit